MADVGVFLAGEMSALRSRVATAIDNAIPDDETLRVRVRIAIERAIDGPLAKPLAERAQDIASARLQSDDDAMRNDRAKLAVDTAVAALALKIAEEPEDIDGAEAAKRVGRYAAMLLGSWWASRRYARRLGLPENQQKAFVRLMLSINAITHAEHADLDKKGSEQVGRYLADKAVKLFERGGRFGA